MGAPCSPSDQFLQHPPRPHTKVVRGPEVEEALTGAAGGPHPAPNQGGEWGVGGYWVLLGGRGGPALTSSHFPPTRDPPMSTSSVTRSTGRQQRMSSQAGTRISDSCGTPLDLPPPPWARVMGWGAAPAWERGAINRGAAAGRRKEPEPWVQNPVPRLYSVGEGQLGGRGRWCGAAGVGCVVVGE